MITKVFRSRTELRLKNEENNFELNADVEGKSMKLLCHKKGVIVRETGKMSNESSGGIEDSLDRRQSNFREANE